MNENTKHNILLVVLIVLIIVLLGLVGLIYRQVKSARDVVISEDSLVSSSVTITPTDNLSVSYDLGSPSSENTEILDAVKDVANRFMQAVEDKSLEEAKPYMTEKYKASATEGDFTQTSNQTMDKFAITNAQAVKTPNTYQVEVMGYWVYQNGQDAGKTLQVLVIKKENDKYLVDEIAAGDRPLSN